MAVPEAGTAKFRAMRQKARDEIIQAANHHIMQHAARYGYVPTLLGPRHINRAVRITRHRLLVPGNTYIRAGFNPPKIGAARKPTLLRALLGEKR